MASGLAAETLPGFPLLVSLSADEHLAAHARQDGSAKGNEGLGGAGSAAKTPTRQLGMIGWGQQFDGVDDFIELTENTALDSVQNGSYTLEAWYMPTAEPSVVEPDQDSYHGVVIKAGNHLGLAVTRTERSVDHWYWAGDCCQASYYYAEYLNGWALDSFEHLVAVRESDGTIWIYVNGEGRVNQDTAELSTWEGYAGVPWRIGIASPGTSQYVCAAEGIIDEVRISNSARSAAWIQASYLNQAKLADYLTVGELIRHCGPSAH